MNIYTDARTIELEMEKTIVKSCEDIVNKSFIINKKDSQEIIKELEKRFDISTENMPNDNDFIILDLQWVRDSTTVL